MELPDFSGLPDWAQGVLYTVAAISLGITIVVPRMGFTLGKSKPQVAATNTTQTVAAVIVDPTALNRHSDAVLVLADKLGKFGEQLDDMREQMRVDAAAASGRPAPRRSPTR